MVTAFQICGAQALARMAIGKKRGIRNLIKKVDVRGANLFVKEFAVDKGVTIKRMRPAAMGSAHVG